MSDSDERSETAPKRLIYDIQHQVLAAVDQAEQEKLTGSVSARTKRELARVALLYRRALRRYRSSDALDEEWENRPIHWLDEYRGKKVPVTEQVPRSNGNARQAMRPAIETVDGDALLAVIDELDDIAAELGFAAAIEEGTPRTEIDRELIEEVEEWRKANQA